MSLEKKEFCSTSSYAVSVGRDFWFGLVNSSEEIAGSEGGKGGGVGSLSGILYISLKRSTKDISSQKQN